MAKYVIITYLPFLFYLINMGYFKNKKDRNLFYLSFLIGVLIMCLYLFC
jgi:hypothetical protein